MEVRDEIKKRMEESLKGCKIIDKQETPKTTILPDLSDPAEYKRWFNMGRAEHLDKDHQKQNLDLNLNLIGILKILLKNNIFYF